MMFAQVSPTFRTRELDSNFQMLNRNRALREVDIINLDTKVFTDAATSMEECSD